MSSVMKRSILGLAAVLAASAALLAGCSSTSNSSATASATASETASVVDPLEPSESPVSLESLNLTAYEKEFLGCYPHHDGDTEHAVFLIQEARSWCEHAKTMTDDDIRDWGTTDNGRLVMDALTMACEDRDRYRIVLKGVEWPDMAEPEEYKDGKPPTRCYPG